MPYIEMSQCDKVSFTQRDVLMRDIVLPHRGGGGAIYFREKPMSARSAGHAYGRSQASLSLRHPIILGRQSVLNNLSAQEAET